MERLEKEQQSKGKQQLAAAAAWYSARPLPFWPKADEYKWLMNAELPGLPPAQKPAVNSGNVGIFFCHISPCPRARGRDEALRPVLLCARLQECQRRCS